ncbi:Dps family protein [Nocardiopsis sp. NPDC057823]|uniref:Dps family protein n=1 Tax=Nocardiopsis sp. NPDC057823 TaxID=3346256 RepID=UPI00366D1432
MMTSLSTTAPPGGGDRPPPRPGGGGPQAFDTVRDLPIGLSHDVRVYGCRRLNRILADTQMLYGLYKKHHWLVHGATFHQLHLLFDEHAGEQAAIVDALAERVRSLGGVPVGDPRHAAEITAVPRPPDGVEEVPAMLSRLLRAHEAILADARDAAARLASLGDDGGNDLVVSGVIRTGEAQVWSLSEHLVDVPPAHM